MEQSYFKKEHFELLNKWQGKIYDKTNPEQRKVYDDLVQAYNITKRWAEALQQLSFKKGLIKVVRKPADRSGKFTGYNWARIYPEQCSYKGVAYTLGIDAELGFVVKIDLVDTQVDDSSLRRKYEQIRGSFTSSPIVAIKSIADGLVMDFHELVKWSAEAINNFSITYEEVVERLGLSVYADNESLLIHFQGHEDFVEYQSLWSKTTTKLFGRFARTINEMGLDWWFTRAKNSQLRFGRKEKGAIKGAPVGWLYLRKDGIRVSWSAFAGFDELDSTDLTNELVQLFEATDKDERSWPEKLRPPVERTSYWPDDYEIEDESKNEKQPKNVIYYGPPGTGKTFDLQVLLEQEYTDADCGERYEFITFHQSYGYEEFVEGIRPVITNSSKKSAEDNGTGVASGGEVRYEVKAGAFLRLCDRARKNPSRRYAMVIDEINRGNISKILGELITLVEVDKREGAKYPISVTLPYSAESFSVPWNVDVIGTMNTADRSLSLLDTALRRRFEFIESMPKPSVLAGTIVSKNGMDINIEQLLIMLNKRIEALYDRDHTVGHAYFTQIKDLDDGSRFNELKRVFKHQIIPLLEEYFFEDWQKIRLVLGDNQKRKQQHQFVCEIGREEDLLGLFGLDYELDQYTTRSRYELNDIAFDEPEAYIGIYTVAPEIAAR